jgi:hypothetical protein
MTQLCIELGEPLFSVEYEDPFEDDYCFAEETVDDVDEWM